MTDTSQGPGWWLASDDKWYPPSAQPGPPSELPEYEDEGGYDDDVSHNVQPSKSRGGNVAIPLIVGVVVVAALIAVGAVAGHSSGSGGSTGALSGVTLDGQPVSLTLLKFVDPAADFQGNNTGSDNDHYVSVQISVTNDGNTTISGDFSADTLGYTSDGQSYTEESSDDAGNPICANWGGVPALGPGASATYCSSFVLPEQSTLVKIQVAPQANVGSGSVSWNVNDSFTGWSN